MWSDPQYQFTDKNVSRDMTADKYERRWSVDGVGGAIVGAIVGAIISAILWGECAPPAEFDAGQAAVGAIIGAIGGTVCGAVTAMKDDYGHWQLVVVFGGIYGSTIVNTVATDAIFNADDWSFWLAVVCGIIGAIMGGITGVVGMWRVRERKWNREQQQREHNRQQREHNRLLFDTAKSLSTKANTLFKQKKYREALKMYSGALDNFTNASEGTESIGDTDLADAISRNITTTQKNIATCRNSIGAEITIEAKNKFENGDLDGALQSYKKSLEYIEDLELTARANNNLKICYREIDVRKVEELSNHAISLLNTATHSAKPFEANSMLKQADDVIDGAVAIVTEQNLTEVRQQLNTISQSIRAERSAIENRITDEDVVVPGDYEVETIDTKPTAHPSLYQTPISNPALEPTQAYSTPQKNYPPKRTRSLSRRSTEKRCKHTMMH